MRFTFSRAVFILAFFFSAPAGAQLQSPHTFLGNRFGKEFTPHESLVAYVNHVAGSSPLVEIQEYGRTYENRPLLHAFISAPENLANLEQIRQNNLRRAGLLPGKPDPRWDNLAIVWLSFGIHGNEAACSETALLTLHRLAEAKEGDIRKQLENTLIILDPSLNPDGSSRYTNWYRQVAGKIPDVRPEAREHQEPWPRGRLNHYHFDLNRDWAWQSQLESRLRTARYQDWLPQIHADFHEQGYTSPYFFAPAAKPYHAYVTRWQRDFQLQIGKNHARYFDAKGWLYFTREVFDLLYPSYGDTYPTYLGAIGMTYEQGGIGAGQAVLLPNGDTLRLEDRIAHHLTTALSTVEMAAAHASRLNAEFAAFYKKSISDPPGMYKTYIVKKSAPASRLRRFCDLLDRNRIQYGTASSRKSVPAFSYESGNNEALEIEPGDLMINACQPRAWLTQILLDPEVELQDSSTYDITAWSLLHAYGLPAFATTTCIEPGNKGLPQMKPVAMDTSVAFAYLMPWESLDMAAMLSQLHAEGVRVRLATKPFTLEGRSWKRGTLVITRGDNPGIRQLGFLLAGFSQKHGLSIMATNTGFSDSGSDLGSRNFVLLSAPRVAIMGGEQAYASDFGQVWYFLEQELGMSAAVLDASRMERTNLDAYNVLIFPEGSYRLSDGALNAIAAWVRKGGRLVLLGDGIGAFTGKSGFAIKMAAADESLRKGDAGLSAYEVAERRELSEGTPGAVFRVNLDSSHPLAFGQEATFFSLKTTSATYTLSGEGTHRVGITDKTFRPLGFVGYKALERFRESLILGAEKLGQGSVIYHADNPLFRDFWDNGKFLFCNTLFFPF